MEWDAIVNRDLAALNAAYADARIDTHEYRLRRRMLLRSAARRRGASIHTLRRPAGAPPAAPAFSHALPMRRATSSRMRRGTTGWPWWLAGAVIACALAAWAYRSSIP
ncbi:hypothetical protein J2T07_002394 [Luteibacter jiangsuensis]|uniref:DUF1707 domain-containing protein n=1 Tax=Luteibacter jiangsuensis TaxID=637577 RepID=A0ABT9SYX6_9GAMM|nr:hypothetical protein [Luteibacter jiangsuensis]MDQ0010204.1 hypothetical protein [Luteibacter jiangsuensis]